MQRIKLWIINYLIKDFTKDFDKINKDQLNNWVKYCYGHSGFNAYCNIRITSLMMEATDSIKSRDEYLKLLGRIAEIRKMRTFIVARFKELDIKEKRDQKHIKK